MLKVSGELKGQLNKLLEDIVVGGIKDSKKKFIGFGSLNHILEKYIAEVSLNETSGDFLPGD